MNQSPSSGICFPPKITKRNLHIDDSKAFCSNNEEELDHKDSARKREPNHDKSHDDEAGLCNSCVKETKATEMQDRNYMKLKEE